MELKNKNRWTEIKRKGNKLLIRERDTSGLDILRTENYEPCVYHPSEDGEYTDIHNKTKFKKRRFGSIQDMNNYVREVNSDSLGGMNNPIYQFIHEEYSDGLQGIESFRVQYIDIEVESDDGFPEPEKAEKVINAISLYDSFDDAFYVFGLGDWTSENSELESHIVEKVIYKKCSDEKELLKEFMEIWTSKYPDIVTGWNTDGFDMIYLYNRMKNVFSSAFASKLSPWNSCYVKERMGSFGKITEEVEIGGINQLDYLLLYKKHTFKNRAKYSLDHIAHVELDDSKLDFEQSSLYDLYKTDFQKYIDYNIKDVDIVLRLNNKLNILGLVIDMAQMSRVNAQDTYSPIRVWDTMIYNYLLDRKIAIPYEKSRGSKDQSIEGAFVKPPLLGLKEWIVSFDLTSLYPSIIRQWNIGPDTIINHELQGKAGEIQGTPFIPKFADESFRNELCESVVEQDVCVAMNGHFYDTTKRSFMNDLTEQLFMDRKASKKKSIEAQKQIVIIDEQLKKNPDDPSLLAKKKGMKKQKDMFHTRQASLKVLLNSLYGAMSNIYFRYFDIRTAESITYTGQAVIRWAETALNDYLTSVLGSKVDRCVAIDTDSIYFDLSEFVQKFKPELKDPIEISKFLDKASQGLNKMVIDKAYEELRRLTNCSEQLMLMDREGIGFRGFWKAKKRYAIHILDMEGVTHYDFDDPEIKVIGLESVQTRYPRVCRDAMEEAYRIVLVENDQQKLYDFVEKFKAEYMSLPIKEIAEGSSVNGLGKWTGHDQKPKKGCPMHTGGSILYNHLLMEYNLLKRYQKIQDGDKINFVMLKKQNPFHHHVLSFPSSIPSEFNAEEYIDKEAMFEKLFLGPLRSLCETFAWKVEKGSSLEDFFL